MDILELQNQISSSLKNLEGKVEQPNWDQWVDFFLKVKNSAVMMKAEKIRRYLILIDTIKAYNEAVYMNSPLVILREAIKGSLKDIKGIGLGLFKALPFIAMGLVGVVALIWIRK